MVPLYGVKSFSLILFFGLSRAFQWYFSRGFNQGSDLLAYFLSGCPSNLQQNSPFIPPPTVSHFFFSTSNVGRHKRFTSPRAPKDRAHGAAGAERVRSALGTSRSSHRWSCGVSSEEKEVGIDVFMEFFGRRIVFGDLIVY